MLERRLLTILWVSTVCYRDSFILFSIIYIVMHSPIARQRLGKHIPAWAYENNHRASFARQRVSKQAFLSIEDGISLGSVQTDYKDVFGSMENSSSRVGSEESSFEMPTCRDMSLGAEELNCVESSELAVAE
jgi:hypothetical protein